MDQMDGCTAALLNAPPPHFDDGGGGGIKRTRKVLSVPNGCTYSLVKGKN